MYKFIYKYIYMHSLDVGNHRHRTDIVFEVHDGPHLIDSKINLAKWSNVQIKERMCKGKIWEWNNIIVLSRAKDMRSYKLRNSHKKQSLYKYTSFLMISTTTTKKHPKRLPKQTNKTNTEEKYRYPALSFILRIK